MPLVKVSDMINVQLDWCVAQIEGIPLQTKMEKGQLHVFKWNMFQYLWQIYSPTTDGNLCLMIIERARIDIRTWSAGQWLASIGSYPKYESLGPSPRMEAMRVFVRSEFGDSVQLPEELCP